MRRAVLILVALLVVAFALSWRANRLPHSPGQVAQLTDRLFEFGAVSFVHGLVKDDPLFACVAEGRQLSPEQSATYRRRYQAVLLDRQRLFTRLDADLQLAGDYCMQLPNNTGGQGIAGLHDQHDLSATANLRDIARNLARLETASPPMRIRLANDVQKDLTDLMVHMAPATHSVGTAHDPDMTGIPPVLSDPFRTFHAGAKSAQFAPVNSPDYWDGVAQMQTGYVTIVLAAQGAIDRHLGPGEQALAGRWLALQTVAPRLRASSPSSSKRAVMTGVCPD